MTSKPRGAPLEGRRIVITRARGQADSLAALLAGLGAKVVHLPTIEITDPTSWDLLDHAIRKVSEGLYDWVVFTSANGVERFFERVERLEKDVRALSRCRIAAIGASTAERLRDYWIRADLVPEDFTGDALADALGYGHARNLLLPRVENGPPEMVRSLVKKGWMVEEAPAYRTVAAAPDGEATREVRAGAFDILTFTSGSTARHFVELVARPGELQLRPGDDNDKIVACIGPRAAEAAESLGFRVDLVPKDHTAEGLALALTNRVGSS